MRNSWKSSGKEASRQGQKDEAAVVLARQWTSYGPLGHWQAWHGRIASCCTARHWGHEENWTAQGFWLSWASWQRVGLRGTA